MKKEKNKKMYVEVEELNISNIIFCFLFYPLIVIFGLFIFIFNMFYFVFYSLLILILCFIPFLNYSLIHNKEPNFIIFKIDDDKFDFNYLTKKIKKEIKKEND